MRDFRPLTSDLCPPNFAAAASPPAMRRVRPAFPRRSFRIALTRAETYRGRMFDRFLNGLGKLMAWGNGAALAASLAMLLFSRGRGFAGGAGMSLTALFLTLTVCGVLLAWRTSRSIRDAAWRKTWIAALQFIQVSGGRVYLLDLAAHLQLGLDETKTLLDQLVREGHGEVTLTEDYKSIYVFPMSGSIPARGVPVTGTFASPSVPVTGTPSARPPSREKA